MMEIFMLAVAAGSLALAASVCLKSKCNCCINH